MKFQRNAAQIAEDNRACELGGGYEARKPGQTYSLAKNERSIHCWRCGMTSHSLGDVQHKYCGCCQQHHTSSGEGG